MKTKQPSRHTRFLIGLSALLMTPLGAQLVNRYSFNDAAGNAPDTTVITDSVGGEDGKVVGNGATFTGMAVSLPGGPGGNGDAAYIDLPNGLLSKHRTVSFEAWYTLNGNANGWARVWDFGSTALGEVETTNVGGSEGQDYFIYSAMRGADVNLQANNVRNLDAATLGAGTAPATGAEVGVFSAEVTDFGTQYHVVSVWEWNGASGGTVRTYRDGALVGGPAETPFHAADMNDVNNWLGRSNWTSDGYLNGEIDEFRIYDVALSETQVTSSMASGPDTPLDFSLDADGDGMPDLYEEGYVFLDPNVAADAGEDEDMDGLTNLEEYNARTRPDLEDTDMDTLTDGDEVKTFNTNPLLADSDADGLNDADELNIHSTDPNDPDSDGDGIPDGYEVGFAFLDPNDDTDAPLDEDSDGLTNLEEFNAGTEPDVGDTDADGLNDGIEVNTEMTDPLVADSDGDGLSDGFEVNDSMTKPLLLDTDGDGIYDGAEVSAGLDPLSDGATSPRLIHRYSFNATAGDAANGATVPDPVGGADGRIVGTNALWTGDALTLPGGGGADSGAAYVDLPNGILSAHDHVTFEAWYTLRSPQAWGRIWDFGSTEGGELNEGGSGVFVGQDYFAFAPQRGANIDQQRYTVRNLDPAALGGGTGPSNGVEYPQDTDLVTELDREYHVAGVWTSDGAGGGEIAFYRDGMLEGARTVPITPRDMNDVNNWLGRSNWTGDSYLHGDLNEFRIYEGAMNSAAAGASFTAGPDAALGGSGLIITDFSYDALTRQFTITWASQPGRTYSIFYSEDLANLDAGTDLTDSEVATGTSTTFGPFTNPLPNARKLFFHVSQNP